MVGFEFVQVDAFAEKPFRGNPAAVFVLPRPRPAAWMQEVASEMNLSETAFLRPLRGGFSLRWFTPAQEVPLCGHATLASAHVLWERGTVGKGDPVRFHTKSGLLVARAKGGWIELDFPALPQEPSACPAGLGLALGAKPRYVGRGPGTILVEVASEAAVRRLKPDPGALKRIHPGAFVVTARAAGRQRLPRGRPRRSASGLDRAAGRAYDFVSRVFAPGEGIDEDPVTGSAHCCLGPYWRERLGKDEFTAYQASERGGLVRVSVRGERVLLRGKAVTVFHGRLSPAAARPRTARLRARPPRAGLPQRT
ncbi:MAG: PhzF family phenazine biosynthesis protein [Elusimicrobia bacterium]|nr:PhzF family phenazine biosynthesis protein [Elusimicrobiota bacterium]